ncbi:LanC-like protein 3 [Elysia marginata]|uniref:LanC-like protein 3 n=1 Tax=Elysia marginata TaxID=1093978 RepID=A0AAV4EN39_9GAST|nr:LanC-like protein 3 [Elysia marginata]
MSPDTTAFPRQFSRAQWKASADEDDKRRLGVITSRKDRNGNVRTGQVSLRQRCMATENCFFCPQIPTTPQVEGLRYRSRYDHKEWLDRPQSVNSNLDRLDDTAGSEFVLLASCNTQQAEGSLNMSRRRFFPNKLPDYSQGADVPIDKDWWHGQILAIVKTITDALESQVSQDGGLYVGSAGVAYMLYYAAEYEPFYHHKATFIQWAESILRRDIPFTERQSSKSADRVSFLLGPSGLYTLGALLGKVMQKQEMVQEYVKKFQAVAPECIKPNFLRCGSDELFVGRAGFLSGALAMEKRMGIKVLDEKVINDICRAMVVSGMDYSKRHRSKSPLMYAYYDTEYLGAAHGLSAILQMILSFPCFLTFNCQSEQIVRSAVDWLLSTQQPDGNFVPATDELVSSRAESDELLHWCHGAPGVVYLLAKAYLTWQDERYLQACLRCGELTWSKGLLKKGPGICHGVAGSGYVFLLLYRLTNDKKYLHRALQFAYFIFSEEFQRGARTPDSPFSLYEGLAGTVCFMLDCLQPERAEFPFFNVF